MQRWKVLRRCFRSSVIFHLRWKVAQCVIWLGELFCCFFPSLSNWIFLRQEWTLKYRLLLCKTKSFFRISILQKQSCCLRKFSWDCRWNKILSRFFVHDWYVANFTGRNPKENSDQTKCTLPGCLSNLKHKTHLLCYTPYVTPMSEALLLFPLLYPSSPHSGHIRLFPLKHELK